MNERFLLLVTIPLTLGAIALTVWCFVRLLGAFRSGEPLATLELVDARVARSVELPAGGVGIHGEGRRFSRDFAGLAPTLVDSSGRELPVQRAFLRSTESGLSTVRVKLWYVEIPSAGLYTIAIQGRKHDRDYRESRLVFLPGRSDAALFATMFARMIPLFASIALVAAGVGASIWLATR